MRKLIRAPFVLLASQVCMTSFAFCWCCMPVLRAAIAQESSSLSPVLFTQVELRDRVLRPRQEINQARTVWYDFRKCEETGRIDNFAISAVSSLWQSSQASPNPAIAGTFKVPERIPRS